MTTENQHSAPDYAGAHRGMFWGVVKAAISTRQTLYLCDRHYTTKAFLPHQRVTTEGFMADDDYTMGEFWRDMKPELKERRRKARNSAHEGMKAFFQRNGVEFEEGENTLIFRTPQGTVAYYPPSKRMQHKTTWRTCSPTACMNYVNKLRAA
ncbi:hypothetical protein KC862_14380 [Enterobacter hormaechei]|uniref:hypothetical protein n=2 Tax=Enterobacteriaceae TaxID=543 RepID=UPI0015D4F8D6|nr:hypothetical protein [Enterobacter hormaechei]MCU4094615.1 hypothetical protein [Enterobacter hormaechei subsp. steigerwaltii]